MPAEKAARASLRKRAQNRVARGRARTALRQAEALLTSGGPDQGQQAVAQAASALDRAAQKGSIHPNNAARRKGRLTRKLNQAQGKAPK